MSKYPTHIQAFISVLLMAVLINSVQAQTSCTTCPEGETPGLGLVTVSFTSKLFVTQPSGTCTDKLCTLIQLNGTIETDGTQTYTGISVPVAGQRTLTDDLCCYSIADVVKDLDGRIITTYNPTTQQATADIVYWDAGTGTNQVGLFLGPESASCTSYSYTKTTFDEEDGFWRLEETITVTFTGGECSGSDDNNHDDDPDNDDDNTDPNDRPTIPPVIPPVDPPDTPVDPPDDDEPVDPPVTDPPTDDECCIAMTTRLDVVINQIQITNNLLGTGNQIARNTNTITAQTNGMLGGISNQIFDLGLHLTDEEVGVLPYIADRLQETQIVVNDIEDYQGAMLHIQEEDSNRQVLQNLYLFQILSFLQSSDDNDTDPSTLPRADDYPLIPPTALFTQPMTMLETTRTNFRNSLSEHGKDITILEDISTYQTLGETQPTWTYDLSFDIFGVANEFGITVDFTKFTLVRDLFWLATILLETVSVMKMVFEETRKT